MKRHQVPFAALLIFGLSSCSQNASTKYAEPLQVPANVRWEQANVLEIVMSDFSFPPPTRSQAWTPLHDEAAQQGKWSPRLLPPQFMSTVTIRPDHLSRIAEGKIAVRPGSSLEIDLIPLRKGNYGFECSVFLHDVFGMRGEAVVE
jgi:hypothetical protein